MAEPTLKDARVVLRGLMALGFVNLPREVEAEALILHKLRMAWIDGCTCGIKESTGDLKRRLDMLTNKDGRP